MNKDDREFVEDVKNRVRAELPTGVLTVRDLLSIISRQERVIEKLKSQRNYFMSMNLLSGTSGQIKACDKELEELEGEKA